MRSSTVALLEVEQRHGLHHLEQVSEATPTFKTVGREQFRDRIGIGDLDTQARDHPVHRVVNRTDPLSVGLY